MYTRRECLMLAAAAIVTRGRVRAAGAPGDGAKPMSGAFMILTTPFTAAGAVDWDDLVREVDFCDRCGVQGLVWPQGSSGVRYLTTEDRLPGLEGRAKAAHGRKPALVLGVQGKDPNEMLEYARRAEALEPDALIAMPPTSAKNLDDYASYFRALAGAT